MTESVRSRYVRELEELKNETLKMGIFALEALKSSVMAFLSYSSEEARKIVERDAILDRWEIDIDRRALNLLALEQPVAKDLRLIVACLRMNIEIERIGDQAVNIAQRTIRLSKLPTICQPPTFEDLYKVAIAMVEDSLRAFSNEDVELANKVCAMDDEADEANFAVMRYSLQYMTDHPSCVEQALQTIIVARCLERSADIATNIAENVIFVVEGRNVKHIFANKEKEKTRKHWDA
ncbi:MAG: phosphate signaling complex protein PhoU [Syntrophobacterales bacterium]|nr:phosphate signaling complex protein PhoU [Syntrophobacterales bacterium]